MAKRCPAVCPACGASCGTVGADATVREVNAVLWLEDARKDRDRYLALYSAAYERLMALQARVRAVVDEMDRRA